MAWLTSTWPDLALVAVKALLIYCTALVALRAAERRTLNQWTIIDFAAAVAVGAIVGRTAVAEGQSFASGAVALIVVVAAHRLASVGRFSPLLARMVDHRIRVLVADGELRRRELRLCGLTDADLMAALRQRGHFGLDEVQFVIYEVKGGLTVVPWFDGPVPELVAAGLAGAAGYDVTNPGARRDVANAGARRTGGR